MSLKQTWVVWSETQDESEQDGRRIEALSADAAAEEWARIEDWQSTDFTIVAGNDETVCVKNPATGEVQRFNVSGRTEAVYDARIILDGEGKRA